jgi:hypothetical protein
VIHSAALFLRFFAARLSRKERRNVVQWKVHLSQRDPARLPKLLAAIVLGGAAVLFVFKSLWLALIAIVLLIGATGEFLFPISYRLTDEGAFANVLLNRLALKWTDVKRCVPRSDGVLLSPLEFPSRNDAFRGIFLRFAPDGEAGDRASVMAFIARHTENLGREQCGE